MSWYDYDKVDKNEAAPSIIEDIHTAFYSKDYGWACYDEHHSDKDNSFSSIIAFVENGYHDRFSSDKSRVFIHCTNGNTYELKVEKVKKNQGYYYGDKKSLVRRLLEWLRNLKCSRTPEEGLIKND